MKNREILQRKMFDYLKSKANEYEGEVSNELKSYRENIQKLAKRDFKVVGLNYLLHRIEKSKIVYLGDFHTFDQSPRNLKRIIKLLVSKGKRITLGLELIHGENQCVIQNFLEGHITELEFLEEINYHESWRFPWKHYKILFDEAKKGNINIIALNSHGNLKNRDNYAANIITDYLKENSIDTLVCLFGEYHIAHNKLPQLVNSLHEEPLEISIIYQNLDDVYWKLTPEVRDETQVVSFSDVEYSILSSPPWIKYESMIYWFENLCDDPDFDFHESLLESHANAFNDNVFDNFLYISQALNEQFKFHIPKTELENFNLYDYRSLDFILEELEEEQKNEKLYKFYETLIEKDRSFKVISKNDYYCSSYSINRLAYLSGLHLFTQHQDFKPNDTVLKSQDLTEIFIYLTLRDLFGYFCSKMINPYRKCNLFLDFKSIANKKGKEQGFHKTLVHLCEEIVNDGDFSTIFKNLERYEVSKYSRSIGYMLGDVLYELHTDTKNINVLEDTLIAYLVKSDYNKKFSSFFNSIISEDRMKNLKKSYF